MVKSTFNNPQSSEFWQICKAEMQPLYLGVIIEVLNKLDACKGESSVRSRYSSRGEYSRQGEVSLLEHSINVAMICREIAGTGVRGSLAVIAGLAHDTGKIPGLHCGGYTAVMHAHWGAIFLSGIVMGRLVDSQAADVIDAVKNHHLPVGGKLHPVLRKADRRAREDADQLAVDRLMRLSGGVK